jgi:hypothetical protein
VLRLTHIGSAAPPLFLAACGGESGGSGGEGHHYSQTATLACLKEAGYATETVDTFEAYQKSHLAPQIGIGDAGEGFITIGLPKGLSGPRADWANTLDIGFERTEKDAERSYRFASSFGTEDISGHKGNAARSM